MLEDRTRNVGVAGIAGASLSYVSTKKSCQVMAAGTVVVTRCPQTGSLFALLGGNRAKELCHQHGWNDEAKFKHRTASVTPYAEAAILTACKEYAEEALEVVGSEEQVRIALQSTLEGMEVRQGIKKEAEPLPLAVQIFPRDSINTAAFLVFAGELGPAARIAVLKRFHRLHSCPTLKRCEKDIYFLAWVNLRDLAQTFGDDGDSRTVNAQAIVTDKQPSTSQSGSGKEDSFEDVPVRSFVIRKWLRSYFKPMFAMSERDKEDAGPGTELFVSLCCTALPLTNPFQSNRSVPVSIKVLRAMPLATAAPCLLYALFRRGLGSSESKEEQDVHCGRFLAVRLIFAVQKRRQKTTDK